MYIIPYHTLVQTCFAVPWSWEGKTLDGHEVYIKERRGILRVYIGDEIVLRLGGGYRRKAEFWQQPGDAERLAWIAKELEAKGIAAFIGEPEDAQAIDVYSPEF